MFDKKSTIIINFVQLDTWVTDRHEPAFYSELSVHCIFLNQTKVNGVTSK